MIGKWFNPTSEATFLRRWLGVSLVFHLVTAWFSLGYHSADEQFQILEFLSYKLGHAPVGTLAVEFPERMRPWLQVLLDYGIVRVWQFVGVEDPFVWVRSLRFFNGLIGWASVVALAHAARVWFTNPSARRWAIRLLCGLWYLPLLHVRPSSESLAGSTFCLGVALLTLWPQRASTWIAAGALWALSFESRFQMGLMIAGGAAWLAYSAYRTKTGPMRHWAGLAGGFLAVFALGRLADFWGHGDWSFTPWNYFSYNLVRGEVSRYGQEPWWDPLLRMPAKESWPILGLLATWATVLGWYFAPRHFLTWAQIPFFLIHELIAHKEFRFFFPIALGAPILMVYGGQGLLALLGKWRARIPPALTRGVIACLIFSNGVALGAHALLPLARTAQFYELVWRALPDPGADWTLYTPGRDPYEVLGTPIYFYRPPGLTVRRFQNLSELPTTGEVWLFWPKLTLPEEVQRARPSCRSIAQTLPTWARTVTLNLNGWADRANAWSLWRCD